VLQIVKMGGKIDHVSLKQLQASPAAAVGHQEAYCADYLYSGLF